MENDSSSQIYNLNTSDFLQQKKDLIAVQNNDNEKQLIRIHKLRSKQN